MQSYKDFTTALRLALFVQTGVIECFFLTVVAL